MPTNLEGCSEKDSMDETSDSEDEINIDDTIDVTEQSKEFVAFDCLEPY
ncbi:unnamed protein product, partial [Rotaria sp. Silwood2]